MSIRAYRFVALVAVIAATLLLAACGSSASPSQSSPGSGGVANDAARYFAIVEIGLGANGYVALENYTDQPAQLEGLRLCQARHCVTLTAADVEPGNIVRISVGDGSGVEGVVIRDADLQLEPSNGEVALMSAGSDFTPEVMRTYLEWGSTPHGLTSIAIEAGLWHEGSYAPTAENATRLFKTDANLWVFDAP
jgi:hypothetical protein